MLGLASGGREPADCRFGIGIHLKGLILAQNERWRRGLGMQVEREAFLREGGQRQTA